MSIRQNSKKATTTASSAAADDDVRANGFFARGRQFTPRQVALIISLVSRYSHEGRIKISQRVCRALRWRQPNGALKDMACREILRKLDGMGVISLPPPKWGGAVWRATNWEPLADHKRTEVTSIDHAAVRLHRIKSKRDSEADTWNELVQCYHYLRTSRIVGRQIKYIAYHYQEPIACFGWGDAAWAQQSRDNWIGWSAKQRQRNRHRVVNNCRFLIPPWVRVPNLASFLIGRCTDALLDDWEEAYGRRPVLLETFVDAALFTGTCYRAANWTKVGVTAGYAKTGSCHHNSQSPKLVFLYPTTVRFRDILCGRNR